jgi:four helix bundle protein
MENNKKFDLEERTTQFGKNIVRFCRSLKQDPINSRICGQLVGSAGSVGANYREANDSLGKKDFVHRLKISRKEAKETIHWLEMLLEANPDQEQESVMLKKEATELRNILSAIIIKVSDK